MSQHQYVVEQPGVNARPPVKMGATLGSVTITPNVVPAPSQSVHVYSSYPVGQRVIQSTVSPPMVIQSTVSPPMVIQSTVNPPMVIQSTVNPPTVIRSTVNPPVVIQSSISSPTVIQSTVVSPVAVSSVVIPPRESPSITIQTWICDSCRKVNAPVRFQCMQCRVGNTYDLCGSCIAQAAFIHPGHTLQQISSTVSVS